MVVQTLRLQPTHRSQAFSGDFVQDRTHDGRLFRILTVTDAHTYACLAIKLERRLHSLDFLAQLADLFVELGPPEHVRSDND